MRKLRILVACAVLASFAFLQVSDGTAEASGACGKIKGDYAFRLTSFKSFSAESLATSGLATAPYQDILRVGILKIADSCQVTADVRATIDNNAGATRLVVFKW